MDQKQRYIIDRVREETNLDECALCCASSCFACIHGYCTALEKFSTGGCAFYKDAEENRLEICRCFYRLIHYERFDLLYKYAETLAALGLMDQELKDTEKQRMMLAEYQRRPLAQLCADHWTDTLIVVGAPDEENDDKDDVPADAETQEPDPESEFDNDIDKWVCKEKAKSTEV